MSEDGKNSNLMIIGLGIVTVFLAYLIYMKSKDTQTRPILESTQSTLQSMPQLTSQPIDNLQLYQIQLQTQQINDILKTQASQIQLIQEQQLNQSESIANLENTKYSNIVSMNDNNNKTNNINNINSLRKLNLTHNIRKENEEMITNTLGMR